MPRALSCTQQDHNADAVAGLALGSGAGMMRLLSSPTHLLINATPPVDHALKGQLEESFPGHVPVK